jgi:signal transduction histidine kinase
MRFPLPPFRYLLPALLLAFGLAASWTDYRLNLKSDRQRIFVEVTAQADSTAKRLAQFCSKALAKGDQAALRDGLTSWSDEPWLRSAALVDAKGIILADTTDHWTGRPAKESPAASAWKLVRHSEGAAAEKTTRHPDEVVVSTAMPLPAPATAWVLVVFDRTDAVTQANADARHQLLVSGSIMGLLCLGLWAVLHFGVARRLAQLARTVKQVGEDELRLIEPLHGSDEVHDLSSAFAKMTSQLIERERERAALEREVIESTERERRRIGHELHDGIGQHLTAVLMATNAMTEELHTVEPTLVKRAESVISQLRNTISEVRALSHGLAPVPLWESGLEHALQSLAESTSQHTEVRCVFECEDPVSVENQEIAGNLYRIAQEAVNNALKHAKAGEIRVGLEVKDGMLVLEIDDDGEGLPEGQRASEGIGLRVMRHRAYSIGGQFSIGAAPAGGTRVAVHLPLHPSTSPTA